MFRAAQIGGFYSNERATPGSPVTPLGHFQGDIRTEAVKLFHDEIEAGVADRLYQVLALNPERFPVVPGRPAAIFAVAECQIVLELPAPAALQAFILGES